MAKKNIKSFKNITTVGGAVEREVKWQVEVTNENLNFLQEYTGSTTLEIGDIVDMDGQVFVKRLSYSANQDTIKAYDFEFNPDDVSKSRVKNIDVKYLNASRLLNTICVDKVGNPYFSSIEEVYNSDPKFIDALFTVSDEVNNFLGKSRTQNLMKTKSGANLSSTELVEKPLKKPSQK